MIGFHKEKAHHGVRGSAVMHIDVPYSPGDFASDTKESMSFKNYMLFYIHIEKTNTPAVGISGVPINALLPFGKSKV